VATSGTTALFTWRSDTLAKAANNLAGCTMAPDGVLGSVFVISSAVGLQLAPSAVLPGDEFLVAWQGGRNREAFFDERMEIYPDVALSLPVRRPLEVTCGAVLAQRPTRSPALERHHR
jgi:hypothetical protein